jgi:hypothetical protein
MKNRIEFYRDLNQFYPGWHDAIPKIEGRPAEAWAAEAWEKYQANPQFRVVFDQVTGGQGVFVA